MRDPYDFINFFKQNVYHEIDDTYHDFLEDIKQLRENHIMIKGHERASGQNYIKIGKKFKQSIEALEVVNQAYQSYPDQLKKETIENLVETLIYERVGTYLRKQIVQMYANEERQFALKCQQLWQLFEQNTNQFNSIMGCQLFPNMQPNRSLKLIKLFLTKSQLPYEMVYILGKSMQMAASELAVYFNKEPNQIDAETIVPYIIMVVIRAVAEVNQQAQ